MPILIDTLKAKTGLTPSEAGVASLILAHPDEILEQSIYALAQKANTSPATITRLCKKCHTANFRDFKIELAQYCTQRRRQGQPINPNVPFLPGDGNGMIASKIAQLSTEAVEETANGLDPAQLQRVITLLTQAHAIYGVAVSGNFLRLRDFQLKLLKIDYAVTLLDLQAEQYYLAYHAGPSDVALIVSYSGRTAEIVNDAKLFRTNHTPIIAITADPQSPLATYAQEVLTIPMSETAKMKVSDFSSQIAIEYVLNTLYACLFNRNFDRNYHNQSTTPVAHF